MKTREICLFFFSIWKWEMSFTQNYYTDSGRHTSLFPIKVYNYGTYYSVCYVEFDVNFKMNQFNIYYYYKCHGSPSKESEETSKR